MRLRTHPIVDLLHKYRSGKTHSDILKSTR
jgi:hypothetical protein